jgi:type II secretory pathway component PulF
LNEGYSFSDGLKREKGFFSPIVLALIRVGEETGRLDETLERAAEHLLRVEEIISNTKRALLYPLFILFSMGGAFLFWLFFVLPKVLKLFQEFDTDLPLATKALIWCVNWFNSYWPVCAGVLLLTSLLLFFLWRHPSTRLWLERILLVLPIVGKAKRVSTMAFFFEYLTLLFEAGIDAVRSLEIVSQAQKGNLLSQVVETLKRKILEGYSLAQAFQQSGAFSPLELRMIKVGEETGRLVEQFRYLSDYYYRALEAMIEILDRLIEPIFIVLAGILFLALALALLGPIYDLVSNLGAF